jgi:NAD(P)-dependent dehydrogenase (short-subunit alcohol dehydrogenase family)
VTRPTILVTGASGQLGYELARLLPAHGAVTALDRAQLDLADTDAIRAAVRALRPSGSRRLPKRSMRARRGCSRRRRSAWTRS